MEKVFSRYLENPKKNSHNNKKTVITELAL